MLQSGVAIRNEVHVHAEQRTAFRHDQHILRARSGGNLLALFAARLVVVLHRHTALRLDSANMGKRILIAVDACVNAGCLGSVDDLAGRKDARGKQRSGLLAFCRSKDHAGRRRGIVDRGRP